jgi:hypothetical protein
MKKIGITIYLLVSFLFFNSCEFQTKDRNETKINMIQPYKVISLKLDSVTGPRTDYIQVSKKYIAWLNAPRNEIILYNKESALLERKITIPREGPNSLFPLRTFYIHNEDSIFATNAYDKLTIFNRNKEIINELELKPPSPVELIPQIGPFTENGLSFISGNVIMSGTILFSDKSNHIISYALLDKNKSLVFGPPIQQDYKFKLFPSKYYFSSTFISKEEIGIAFPPSATIDFYSPIGEKLRSMNFHLPSLGELPKPFLSREEMAKIPPTELPTITSNQYHYSGLYYLEDHQLYVRLLTIPDSPSMQKNPGKNLFPEYIKDFYFVVADKNFKNIKAFIPPQGQDYYFKRMIETDGDKLWIGRFVNEDQVDFHAFDIAKAFEEN